METLPLINPWKRLHWGARSRKHFACNRLVGGDERVWGGDSKCTTFSSLPQLNRGGGLCGFNSLWIEHTHMRPSQRSACHSVLAGCVAGMYNGDCYSCKSLFLPPEFAFGSSSWSWCRSRVEGVQLLVEAQALSVAVAHVWVRAWREKPSPPTKGERV